MAIVAYALVFFPYLPSPDGLAGLDFSYFLPQLLSGYYWFENNGLFSVPWFTPAFCAGIPYYANMQAMYPSLPQFLTFVANPFVALQISFVTFAAAGLGGLYALLRRAFGMSRWIALAAGVMFLFNEFYPARFLAGHVAFHAFMLTPIVALGALAGSRSTEPQRIFDVWVLVAALVLAYMVQSGMVHAMPPSLLAILAILLVHGYLFGLRATPFMRLMTAGGLSLVLSAAKLVSGIAYLSHFPREMIPLSGFGSLWQSLYMALHSLFVGPPLIPGFAWIQNNHWYPDTTVFLNIHEISYGVTFVPAVLIIAWLATKVVRSLRRRSDDKVPGIPTRTLRPFIALAIGSLLFVPIALNWYQPTWTAFLKDVPVIGNSSTLIRWFCMYIPVVIMFSALCVERDKSLVRMRPYIALIIITAVISISATTDRQYYKDRGNYDVAAVVAAHSALRGGAPVPAVERVEWPRKSLRDLMFRPHRNDSFVAGATSAKCYEPMFGHRLEEYPYGPLREGPTLEVVNGLTNIKNPACMVYPEANKCKPGDHFTEDEISDARDFVNYKPFPFQMPWWQKLANGISLAGLAVMFGSFVFYGVRFLLRIRQRMVSTGYSAET